MRDFFIYKKTGPRGVNPGKGPSANFYLQKFVKK
jgi:hypothetical protein